MSTRAILSQFGFDGKKADVYLALLELGRATANAIARLSGVKRTTCYDILQGLEKEGLTSRIQIGKKKLFVAEDPNKLEETLKEKEEILGKLLGELNVLYQHTSIKSTVRFFEGRSGLWEVYEDILKYKGEYMAFIASEEEARIAGFNEIDEYIRRRVEKGIRMRALMPKTESVMRRYGQKNKEQLRKAKFINQKKYPFSVEINIYGRDKVAFMSVQEEVGIIVEGQKTHDTFKSIFELLWDSLPKTSST